MLMPSLHSQQQNTCNLSSSDNTMPKRKRKSPRKNSGMQPDYYRTGDDQDSREITSEKAGAKPPSKKRHRIGYKEALKKKPTPARMNSSESSSESLACVCSCPPVTPELLLILRYQSLVTQKMTSPPYPGTQ